MDQLAKHEYEKIRRLFPYDYPNLPLIFGIIEGLLLGKIYVDSKIDPQCCLVMSGSVYCFISGEINDALMHECVQLLQHKSAIKLVIEPTPAFDFLKYGFTTTLRRQYCYKNISDKIPLYENNSHYEIKKMNDIVTFNSCLWRSLMTEIFGTAENYLKNGLSFIF